MEVKSQTASVPNDAGIRTIQNVGASLLAKAGCQAKKMPTDLSPSRAGSLPQGIFIEAGVKDRAAHADSA
ncbi:hypothetical protein DMX03_04720 [Pseudomonas koreensis]|nr:hypothetical protein DMX03_04720 [Pseudomonas koreensis]